MSLQLERGVVGYWCPMLATTGLRLYDRSGRGNSGTLTGMDAASDWVTSKVRNTAGRVLDFDGVNDLVTVPQARFQLPFSVSVWFLSRSATTVQNLFGLGSSTTANPLFQILLRGDLAGDPIQAAMRGQTVTTNTAATISSYTTNRWHHVVAVFLDASYRQIWLDGIEGVADTTNYDIASLNLATIGAQRRTTTGQYLNGQIAECAQWNRSTTASEIRTLYRIGPGWLGKRASRAVGYSEQFAAGFKAYWARRQSQLIGGGV